MDDAAFARFLLSRARLSEAQVRGVREQLPPGVRLAQGLVGSGLLEVEEVRRLWADAEACASSLSASADAGSTLRVEPGAELSSAGVPGSDATLVTPLPIPGAALHEASALASTEEAGGSLPGVGDLVDGRYRVEAELGRGGMGAVYRAQDLTRGRPVALKLILPSLADCVNLERFSREVELAARVDQNAGVVRVYACGRHGPAPYCAMELVEGRDLDKVFREEGPLGTERLLRILVSIAETLAHCHALEVVHRDLKPANVIVTPQDATKLADFGLARDANLERLTHTGELLGTPSYMAPEQADRASEVDGRADLYALGAIFYCGLTGRPPFRGSVHGVMRDLLLRDPPRPSSLIPNLAPDLEAVCMRAMAKDPEDRYPSAEALADDLRRLLAGEAVEARPQSEWFRFKSRYRRGVGRTRTKVHAALILALTLLCGAGFLTLRGLALARAERYQAWADERLGPYAYGLGSQPTFAAADLEDWSARLAWTGPFTSEGAQALSTLAAHQELLAFAAGAQPSSEAPQDPAQRVARACIALSQAQEADSTNPSRASRQRKRALEWVQPEGLAAADPATRQAGARLRLRLELRDPERDAQQRLGRAAELIERQPALASEARAAARETLALALAGYLAERRSDPKQARHLRTLGRACGGEVLRRGVERGIARGAEAWLAVFRTRPAERLSLLNQLSSVCGHGDEAVRPGLTYREAFRRAVATPKSERDVSAAIALTLAICDGVDPEFRPPDSLYQRLQERIAGAYAFDIEFVLFSLRTLPSGSSGKFIPPSLRSSLDRCPDPGGERADPSGRYLRFVAHFERLLKQPRYRRSRALRLLLLTAMRRAGLHKDRRRNQDFVAVARAICAPATPQRPLLDDLAESWQGYALLELSSALAIRVQLLRGEAREEPQAAEQKAKLQQELESLVGEARAAARSAEGRVKPQYAGEPFAKQAELLRDAGQRVLIWDRGLRSLRAQLAQRVAAKEYSSYHYEEALALMLRRRALDLLYLGRLDAAEAGAIESADLARRASSLKRNQNLDSALAVRAMVQRARGNLGKAEEILAERLDVGLQTDLFAIVAVDTARERGQAEEALRRARLGAQQNPRNAGLQRTLQELERAASEE